MQNLPVLNKQVSQTHLQQTGDREKNKLFTFGEKGWTYLKEFTESLMPMSYKPVVTSEVLKSAIITFMTHIDITCIISKINTVLTIPINREIMSLEAILSAFQAQGSMSQQIVLCTTNSEKKTGVKNLVYFLLHKIFRCSTTTK